MTKITLKRSRGVAISMWSKNVEDKSCKRRLSRKAPAAKRMLSESQRDQNLARPTQCSSVRGAPLPMVNEAGAPENAANPRPSVPSSPVVNVSSRGRGHGRVRGRPADKLRPRPHDGDLLAGISSRLRNHLRRLPVEPALGCGKCRNGPGGCDKCKRHRELWLLLNLPHN